VSLYKEYAVSSSATDQKREKHLYAAQPIIGLGLSVETDGGDVSEVDDIVAAFGNTYYGLTEYEDVLTNKYIDDLLEIDGTHALRLSKTESIELAAGVPGGYDCERMTLIGNEYACIGDVIIEGHYIAAIVAGWRASQEIGYVLTNVGVPLITSLPSAEWYDTDDMEVLANAGWFMLYQEMVGGPIINYWQKTTAQDILEKKEQSLVIGLDHVAKTIRDTVDPTCIAKGLANRISTVNPNAPTNIRFLRKVNNALAGPKHYYCVQKEFLADFKVVAVTPNTATRDATDIKVEVSHLYPNNTLNTYIYVV
jgi:hypothetical protein